MARVNKVFAAGTLGPVIFYEFRGKACVRSRPGEVRQTKATKASAKLFGEAATLSKLLRQEWKPVFPDPLDKSLMYRLNDTLFKWLQAGKPIIDSSYEEDPSALLWFEFNPKSELRARLKVRPTVEWTTKGKLIVHIPELVPAEKITAPAGTQTVHWHIQMAGCTTSGDGETWNAEATIDMLYNKNEVPALRIELPFKIHKKSITAVAIGLSYMIGKKGVLKKTVDIKWLPAGVVGVKVCQ